MDNPIGINCEYRNFIQSHSMVLENFAFEIDESEISLNLIL